MINFVFKNDALGLYLWRWSGSRANGRGNSLLLWYAGLSSNSFFFPYPLKQKFKIITNGRNISSLIPNLKKFLTSMAKKNIFSNFESLDKLFKDSTEYNHTLISNCHGTLSLSQLFIKAINSDAVIINISPELLLKLCLLCFLFPYRKFKLISVDLLLQIPTSSSQKIGALIKSLLLTQVDIFVLYFKDTSGYQKYYRISKSKTRYIPFKVNSWDQQFASYRADPEHGNYVLCAGQSRRDLKTFIEAIRIADVPAVLLIPNSDVMQYHGTIIYPDSLPTNLRLEIHSDGKEETYLNWIKNAAIVVIPRFSYDISATGISTYLCSMAAWRCVVISTGPGTEDILNKDQVMLVKPEDPYQMATVIINLWNDKSLRKKIAINGRRYAEQLQGEDRLLHDILKLV